MGQTRERVGKNGKSRYTAYYDDIRGVRRSAGTFASSREADRAWQRAEARLDAGKIGDPKRGKQTLAHYIQEEWLPHHVIEASTRESYTYVLNRYIRPSKLGTMRMVEILPGHVREWIVDLIQTHKANPPTIRKCKVVLGVILTTALNDQVTFLHAGRGVKTPAVVRKPKRIISAENFDALYGALNDDAMRLLVETDIESGLRWGELTELRVKSIDYATGILTVSAVVVHLKAKDRPTEERFLVKQYPKDGEWRQFKIADHLVAKLHDHVTRNHLGPNDLLFSMPAQDGPRRRTLPEELPDPATLGLTDPNEKGRQHQHGTLTAYQTGKCRCRHCKNAVAAYWAARRAVGKDQPRAPRTVDTDGHISGDWFRSTVWKKALAAADLGFHVTPHGLRHAHASWLLAGGADLQIVKERLGHASITTTEKYLHALPGADDIALDALTAVRGNRNTPPTTDPTDTSTAYDPRDAELTELRDMVDTFKKMLGTLGNTA
jgi:site-specific recombinase XerD